MERKNKPKPKNRIMLLTAVIIIFLIAIMGAMATTSVQLNSSLFDNADAMVNSASPTTNYGSGVTLDYNSDVIQKSFLNVQFGNYTLDGVNTYETINSSLIKITDVNLGLNGGTVAGTNTLNMTYCNDTAFTENTITWNNMNTQVTNCNNNVGSYPTITAGWNWYNLTSIYELYNNTGFIIKLEGNYTANKNFNSKEAVTASDRPLLNVTFNNVSALNISIYDETTQSLISGQDVTLSINGASGSYLRTTTAGHYYLMALNLGDYNIRFSSSGYGDRTYNFPLTTNTITNLNIYLINTSNPNVQLVTFTTKDNMGNIIQNAEINISRLYGPNIVQIVSGKTNFQGQIQEYMDSGTNYMITATLEPYTQLSTSLYPAETSYTLPMGNPIVPSWTPMTIQIPKYYTNQSLNISGIIIAQSGLNLTLNTSYNGTLKQITENISGVYDNGAVYNLELTSGSQFNNSVNSTSNIIVYIYNNGTNTANFTIIYLPPPTEYWLTIPTLGWNAILVAIIILTITAFVGYIFKEGNITQITFITLGIASYLLNSAFIYLAITCMAWGLFKIMRSWIKE